MVPVEEAVSTTRRPGGITAHNLSGRKFSMKAFVNSVRAFAQEEDGVALTEYLILLALLVGGVITAVTLAGTNLATVWNAWAGWSTAHLSSPAA